MKVAAVRELWCSVRRREESDTVGRVMDDSERHAACDRAAIEGRTVFLRSFKASFEGALGTMLVRYLVVRECMLLGFQFGYQGVSEFQQIPLRTKEIVLFGSGSIVVVPKSGV